MSARPIFTEEHESYRDQVRRFCEREVAPHIRAWEKAGITPREFWRKAGAAGVLCPTIPAEYGGGGGTFLHACVVTEEMIRVGANFGFAVHSDMVSPYLMHYGSEELKQRLLPRLCRGEVDVERACARDRSTQGLQHEPPLHLGSPLSVVVDR